MTEILSRNRQLGDFLRAHRERLAPSDEGAFGLRPRRTPGLRREEVADLAGMSVTWYTRLEQGREVAASPAAIARLADVLKLKDAERCYLFELAGRLDPKSPCRSDFESVDRTLSETVQAIGVPAYLLDICWNARVWNAAAEELFAGWLRSGEPNLIRHTFLNPCARRFVVDWETRARRLAAQFRADFSRQINTAVFVEMVARLRAESPFFDRAWRDQEVLSREGGARAYNHPEFGLLHFDQTTFVPTSRPDLKLVMLIPRGPCALMGAPVPAPVTRQAYAASPSRLQA